jgi:acetyltransferase-like isoleucine patch superfamily enzyme
VDLPSGMIAAVRRSVDVLRRHSAILNLARNALHVVRNRRISARAWLVIDGELRFGRHVRVSAGCRITVPASGVLELGERVWLGPDVQVDVLSRVAIGAHTSVQRRCSLIGDVEIGRGCLFAPNVFVSSGWHQFDAWPTLPIRVQEARAVAEGRGQAINSRAVRIADDCWLGVNAVVQPGVIIGKGAIIGANAVVTHDIPPYEVVGGVPARRIRSRLEFVPRGELDGMCEGHLPYFYSGFEHGGSLPPVADSNFVLAMALREACAVQLTLRSVDTLPVEIACGAFRRTVRANETLELQVPVGTEKEQDRLAVGLSKGGRVAVVYAKALPCIGTINSPDTFVNSPTAQFE